MRTVHCSLLLLAITCQVAFAQIYPDRIQIARDSFGVPHIFAPTDAEVAYGLAWAHAEDDFRSLQEVVWPAKGLMGRALGKQGAAGDYAYRLFDIARTVQQQWHTLHPAFVALIQGYTAGINAYARMHPQEVVVRGTFPITEQEYVGAAVLALTIFNGADRALGQIFNNRVPTAPGMEERPKGSNAFAIHSSKSQSGDNLLVINAHQPNTGPQSFYEAHVCSEEGWNALGGLLAGGPCILHGVNEHYGWAHTVNYVDRLDVFQLEMHPRRRHMYRMDSTWIRLEKQKVRLRIKGVPIAIGRKAYRSVYGPTMRNKQGYYSIRLGASERIGPLEQWYFMNKGKSFTDFYQTISMQQISMFNMVYADRYDTIFYINQGLVPVRDSSYQWKGTLPGNTFRTFWTRYRSIEELPQYINPPGGFLFNTNHSPFYAAHPADNLKASQFPVADGWETWHNNRSKRVYELMPLDTKISYEELKALRNSKQFPTPFAFPIDIDSLLHIDPATYTDIADIIDLYRGWDRVADTGSRGAAVFHLLFRHLQNGAPRKLTVAEGVAAFRYIKDYQLRYFGRVGIALGELQQLVRGTLRLPMYGMPDVLAAQWGEQQKDGTLKITGGDGYILYARFGKEGLPKLESVNMYGASAKPESPHYADQVPLYLQQKTKPMTLDKATVLQQAVRVYAPGQ